MSVTINEIALKSGVSKSTVSRVLNGLMVKQQTEQRVKRVIEETKYRPNRFARGLVNSQTGFLGLLTPAMDPFVAAVTAGIELETRRFGKLLTLGALAFEERAQEREVIRDLTEPPMVDGLLFFLPPPSMEYLLRNLARRNFPFVVLGERRFGHFAASVVVDNLGGAKQATDYLIQKGHDRIGFIGGRPEAGDSAERFEGYQQALAGAEIPFDPQLVQPGTYDIQSGVKAAGEFLNMADPPTAVFASNDAMAIGLLKALHAKKMEGAFAVAGFDDIEMASFVSPSLTTIGYDLNELGRQAVQQLMRLVTRAEKNRSVIQLQTHLIARESA